MDSRLPKLEAEGSGGGGGGGGGGDGSGGDRDGGAKHKSDPKDSKLKYCKTCSRKHVVPAADCHILEKNAAKRPEGFVVRSGYAASATTDGAWGPWKKRYGDLG